MIEGEIPAEFEEQAINDRLAAFIRTAAKLNLPTDATIRTRFALKPKPVWVIGSKKLHDDDDDDEVLLVLYVDKSGGIFRSTHPSSPSELENVASTRYRPQRDGTLKLWTSVGSINLTQSNAIRASTPKY